MKIKILIPPIFLAAMLAVPGSVISREAAQIASSAQTGRLYGAPQPTISSLECKAQKKQSAQSEAQLMFYSSKWNNTSRERKYRQAMERMLAKEALRVKQAMNDIKSRHDELAFIYPAVKNYQELQLKNLYQVEREGRFVNFKKKIAFHYQSDNSLDCVVLVTFTRDVYSPAHWTRKIIRIRYPDVRQFEVRTEESNYLDISSIKRSSPEVQLEALQRLFGNLRQAIYIMDNLIAYHYQRRNQIDRWQINL